MHQSRNHFDKRIDYQVIAKMVIQTYFIFYLQFNYDTEYMRIFYRINRI